MGKLHKKHYGRFRNKEEMSSNVIFNSCSVHLSNSRQIFFVMVSLGLDGGNNKESRERLRVWAISKSTSREGFRCSLSICFKWVDEILIFSANSSCEIFALILACRIAFPSSPRSMLIRFPPLYLLYNPIAGKID